MIRNAENWENEELAWISILGTRVQMGQVSMSQASRLVARSYANIVGATNVNSEKNKTAMICFLPDPVCARLAMCLMDEKWSLKLTPSRALHGKPKHWWIEKMMEVYSKSICSPEKGNFGEVAVALYFLFCADTLRCKSYDTFSVPLDQWIQRLISDRQEKKGTPAVVQHAKKSRIAQNCLIDFSAIQVCRNYTRSYDDSWSFLQEESFLENLYKS
eukprot:scaffold26343_cov168-Amphora_coffeaeformis.AAC.1